MDKPEAFWKFILWTDESKSCLVTIKTAMFEEKATLLTKQRTSFQQLNMVVEILRSVSAILLLDDSILIQGNMNSQS